MGPHIKVFILDYISGSCCHDEIHVTISKLQNRSILQVLLIVDKLQSFDPKCNTILFAIT